MNGSTDSVEAPAAPALNPSVAIGPEMKEQPGTVVVLGAARGGTSMIAGLLRILGRDMGLQLNPDNNEDIKFLQHGGDRRLFLEPEFAERKCEYLSQIKEYISRRNATGNRWGWKDPLSSYYILDVLNDLKSPAFIFVTRDPVAIAIREASKTDQLRDTMLANMLNATAEYTSVVHLLTNPQISCLLVSYERSVRQPMQLVASLRDFLKLPPNESLELRAAEYVKPDRGGAQIEQTDVVA